MSTEPTITIQSARAKATSLGIPLTRDMNKDVILRLIEDAEGSGGKPTYGFSMGTQPLPGYARVVIHKGAAGGSADLFACVNGFACLIRRGVEVDIPIKILRGSLMTAKQNIARYDENERDPEKRFTEEEVYSYPFSVLAITEGRDPKHYQHETAQRKKKKNQKVFWKVNGYYPKPRELREWIAGGGLEKALEELKGTKNEDVFAVNE